MTSAAVQKLYMNEEQQDIVFHVGRDKDCSVRFPAHKLVLSAASPIFSAMFNENYRERETGEVYITDIVPSTFQNLLKFAYFGKFEALTVASYTDTMHAADKYFMPELTKFCLTKLEYLDVSFDNFWNFFTTICRYYSESMSPKIVTRTLEFLDANANKILSSIDFQHLNSEAVITILRRSTLKNTCETEILRDVLQWSRSACARQNLEINTQNETKMLEDVKYYIRYLTIPKDKLLSEITTLTFLDQNEKTIILDAAFRGTGSLPPPWDNILIKQTRERNSTKKLNVNRRLNIPASLYTYSLSWSLLLVAAYDCVFEGLEVNVSHSGKVNGDIADLDGKIYDVWVEPCVVKGDNVVLVGKPFCLKKCKAYKLNLVCDRGCLVEKCSTNGHCVDGKGDIFLYLKNFPDDSSEDLKSTEYWEKYFTTGYKNLPESGIHKTIVNSVTIKI